MSASPSSPLRPASAARTDRLIAIGVAVLGLATRLPFLDADEGWFDEIFSIYTAAQPVGDILRGALTEQTNPPGYYLLAHLWGLLGGTGVPWHRMLSALSGALAPAVIVLVARRLGLSRATSTVAGVLALAAPFLWQMSLEIRAYAPLALMTALALWVAAGIVRDDAPPSLRSLLPLALLHAAMVLLHYFGAFGVAGISVGTVAALHAQRRLTWQESTRILLLAGAPAAACIAVWLGIASSWSGSLDGRNVAWIPDTTALAAIRSVPSMVLGSLGPYGRLLSYGLMLGGLAVALAWAFARRRSAHVDAAPASAIGQMLLCAAVLPIAMALGLHLLAERNLWVARYVSGFIPGLALLAALVVEAVPQHVRAAVATGIALWWFTAGALSFANRTPKPDWTQILAILAPDGRGTICADGTFVGLPFIFHARARGLTEIQVVNPGACRPGAGPTWLVYAVERSGVVPPPQVPGLVLGPRVVLFRGLQSLDARRVIRRD